MEKRKIIMDCDPGVDDALALAYAAANPDAFEIIAITTVSGNQTVEKTTRNALDLADFYGLDVPVAKGMSEPITREAEYAPDFHGENGLGNVVLPTSEKTPVKENAVVYMNKIISELPEGEKVTLIVTGPMTNVGLLLKVFPEVKEKIQEILFMGGGAMGGNTTPAAEFNVYVDPESVKIVFESGIPLVMCGLDVTEKSFLTSKQIMKLSQSEKRVAKACGSMIGFSLEGSWNKYRAAVSVHDAVPFMYLTHPEIFTAKKAVLDIDCSYGVSRGATICDFRWWSHDEEELKNLVVMDVETERFQEYLITALYELA